MISFIIILATVISLNTHGYSSIGKISADCNYKVDDHTLMRMPIMELGGELSSVIFNGRQSNDPDGMYLMAISKNIVGSKNLAISLARIDKSSRSKKIKGKTADIFKFNYNELDLVATKVLSISYKIKRKKIRLNCNLSR